MGCCAGFCHAQGLCQCCAEKWSRDHRCAEKVHLHALQELLDMFPTNDTFTDQDDQGSQAMDQLFFTLSEAVVTDAPSPRTMCLMWLIQDKPMRILIDSRSSHTFISTQLSSQLVGVSPMEVPVQVKVANGQLLKCDTHLQQETWYISGYEFQSDLKVLPLSSYDMILGLDRLKMYSHMNVHWKFKWMSIPYQGSYVLLCGDLDDLLEGSVVQVCSVQASTSEKVEVRLLEEIQQLIEAFADLFEGPTQLPPA